jgi:hypothetical protein
MKMFKHFGAMFAIVASLGAALAQEKEPEILVASPPKYQVGESFTGNFEMPELGIVGEVRQSIRVKNRKPFLYTDMVSNDGMLLMHAEIDPVTMLGNFANDIERGTIVFTTCPPDRQFPIYLGKKLECSLTVRINGRSTTRMDRYTITNVTRGTDGTIAAICSIQASEKITIYMCSTPDFKWTVNVKITSASQL